MTKVGTSEPLKIILLKAMREWLVQEGKVESDWTFPQDDEHASLPQALAGQKQIGWHSYSAKRILETEPTSNQ